MQWISVNDQLPEEGKNVLVFSGMIDVNNIPIYEIATYRIFNNGSCFVTGPYSLSDITHWMPLPQPPKESYD